MTIEEAIKRYVDNAEYERTHGNLQGYLEFKQLANWLKELKQLRVFGIHAIDKNTIGFQIEGNRYKP